MQPKTEPKKITAVIDLSPIIFRAALHGFPSDVANRTESAEDWELQQVIANMRDALEWVGQAAWLQDGKRNITVRTVLVTDVKPYWRSAVYPEYKMGRKPKSALFHQAKAFLDSSEGCDIREKHGLTTVGVQGFEADDLAAFYSRNHKSDHCVLVTLDSDWLQLVSRESACSVYNTYCSRLYTESDTVEDITRRLNKISKKARKRYDDYTTETYQSLPHQMVVSYKRAIGDSSDNLPIDCSRELVDLLITRDDLPTDMLQSVLGDTAYTAHGIHDTSDLYMDYAMSGRYIPIQPYIKGK